MFFFLTFAHFKLIPCLTLEAVNEVEHPETGPGHWQIFKLFGLKLLRISK